MYATDGTPQRARWEVLWIKDRRIIRKDFGTDLQGAVDLYARVSGKRRGVTLRCRNMGFPPPDRLADREEVIVRHNGRRVKGKRIIEPKRYVETMDALNRRGVWWCPYCRQLRRFVRRNGYHFEGHWIERAGMHCPMCGVSQSDFHVRRYNPITLMIEMRGTAGIRKADPNNSDERKRERARERRRARARRSA